MLPFLSMTPTHTACMMCHQRPSEFMLYPNWAAYNSSSFDRPRQPICGHCAATLIENKQAERTGPFGIVLNSSVQSAVRRYRVTGWNADG